MNSKTSLRELQTWMQQRITDPSGSLPQSLEAAGSIDAAILPSRALSSCERLAIYHNAYFGRLFEALEEFFPATAAAMGEDLFREFALGYLQAHPSTSYTLGRLADHFVGFLAATRPPRDTNDLPDEPDLCDFFVELSGLEWQIDSVFDGPGIESGERLTADQLSTIPKTAWAAIRFKCSPSLRLMSFRFPVNDYYSEFRNGAEPEIPAPQDTYLALFRRDFVVRRWPLHREQFLLLQDLLAGHCLGDSVQRAAIATANQTNFTKELSRWFSEWAAAELFQRAILD